MDGGKWLCLAYLKYSKIPNQELNAKKINLVFGKVLLKTRIGVRKIETNLSLVFSLIFLQNKKLLR